MLIEADRLSSVIFWGPPGTGQDDPRPAHRRRDHARRSSRCRAVNASGEGRARGRSSGAARAARASAASGTILFLDEIHRFNKAQQDALLPRVEDGLLVLIGATTENPYFEVNPPLLSRLDPVPARAARAATRAGRPSCERGPRRRGRDRRRRRRRPPRRPRRAATAARCSPPRGRGRARSRDRATGARARHPGRRRGRARHEGAPLRPRRPLRRDHARSSRASAGRDPDAGLYWLARMLEAGEDARFIARRLVILASEDVGMADPMALLVADAAARAVEFVGPARGAAQPGPGGASTWPPRRSRTAPRSASGTPGQDVRERRRRRGAAAPARRPLPRRGDRSATARATRTLTTIPGDGCDQQYRPDDVGGRVLLRAVRPRLRAGGAASDGATAVPGRSGGCGERRRARHCVVRDRAVRARLHGVAWSRSVRRAPGAERRCADAVDELAGRDRAAARRAARLGGRGARRPRSVRPGARLGRGDLVARSTAPRGSRVPRSRRR